MVTQRTTLCVALGTMVAVALTGCVKRKETIKVADDGGVTARIEYEADSLSELTEGDALPSHQAGWSVDRKTQVDDDGDETHIFLAEKVFPPGMELPGCYAGPDDPDVELYLRFPTTLTIEQRADGTYYHFHRSYPLRRHWAHLEAISAELIGEIDESLPDPDDTQWNMDHWSYAVERLVRIEVAKMTAFARSALRDADPDAPQDAWLRIRAALQTMEKDTDCARLAHMLTGARDDEEQSQALIAEAQAIEAEAMNRMTSALAEVLGDNRRLAVEFADAYQWHKRYHEISEDLADEAFEIIVQMPGEIVAANTDKLDGNQATWEFSGEDLRDRNFDDLDLMVTSHVAK